MNIIEIIEKKRDKQALSEEEINFWINGVCDGSIPEYQTSALLMAIYLNGMNEDETFYFTKAMAFTGDILDFKEIDGIKVDKHSSGGVGDKTSMALMPLVVSCGVKAAKMSGPALGFMGGTVDKLSSIPNMNVFLSKEELVKQVQEIGIAMIGHTGNLCLADKKIYALRDVTGTVAALPLIVSSMMCKKLACGDDVILLDVKYGNGSECPTLQDGENLARQMISVGKKYGKKIGATLSSMKQPLGKAVGNALEVKEAIATLHGNGPKDFTELVETAATELLFASGIYDSKQAALDKVRENISNGKAAELFKTMINHQGGLGEVVDNPDLMPKAPYVTEIKSKANGYVTNLKGKPIGELSMALGAGRQKADDEIDYSVGIVLERKIGDEVKVGDTLAYIHHNRPLEQVWVDKFYSAYEFGETRVEPSKIIEEVIW